MTWGRALAVIAIALSGAFQPLSSRAVDRTLGTSIAKPGTTGAAWSAREKRRLARDLDVVLAAAPTLRGAHLGLIVIDTRSAELLYSRNADDDFTPASTMKLLTGSVALATLGPAFRFHTEAYLAPEHAPSHTYGDVYQQTLYLRAGGDPRLRAEDVRELGRAAFLTGAFHFPYPSLIDGSAFEPSPYPPGWSWDDFGYDYAAQLSPAPVDENAMQITVTPGREAGTAVTVNVSASGLDRPFEVCSAGDAALIEPLATTGIAGSGDTLEAVRDRARGCIEITGSLPAGSEAKTLDVAVPEPASHLMALIGSDLPVPNGTATGAQTTGVQAIGGSAADVLYRSYPVPPGARLVWSHDGEPLSDLLADMWWPSDNFVAEMLLRAIGLQHSGRPGTTAHGADAERLWLSGIGIDPATLTIADGSGLSIYDRLTPRVLGAILQADWNGPYRDIVLDDLPLAGVRGTLQTSFAGTLAERRTFAKTGSVSHARGLAGYLATLRHGAVTFAWSVDDWMGNNDDLAAVRARVLSRIIGD